MSVRNSSGFTLIEILIAMAILAFIATGTGAAVVRGIQVKKRVETEWQKAHGIRTALRILERDIYLAFHEKQKKSPFGFRSSDQDLWFKSFFKGKEDHLFFTSSSHRRI